MTTIEKWMKLKRGFLMWSHHASLFQTKKLEGRIQGRTIVPLYQGLLTSTLNLFVKVDGFVVYFNQQSVVIMSS